VTDNRIIGRTNHPLDATRTPGGSSGGEAAAISSFMSAGGIGSDGGGSIREPAHFCGICGLKPTPGRVPAFGHWPEIANPTGFMGVGGPMARTAADVRLLFSVLAGHDARDPYSVPLALRELPSTGARIAVINGYRVQPACAAAVDRAASLLTGMGHQCEEFSRDRIDGAHDMWRSLFVDYLTPGILQMIAGREDQCSTAGLQLTKMVRETVDVGRLGEILFRRDRMRGELLHWMGVGTIIVAPAFGVTAFQHGQKRFPVDGGEIGLMEAIEVVSPWNLLGMPAMVVPMGVDENGMPAGVQLIGPPWCEELVLDLAVRLEEARGTEWDSTTFSRMTTSSTTSPTG
jgi:Asp-tRNA(Asn)/Glu-tRNA(Gln) amidotransferase A subunit family amidase